MTSLRMRVVEAGAEAMRLQEHGVGGPLDDVSKQKFAAALDAMLDCLAENGSMYVRYDENHSTELQFLQVQELVNELREDR